MTFHRTSTLTSVTRRLTVAVVAVSGLAALSACSAAGAAHHAPGGDGVGVIATPSSVDVSDPTGLDLSTFAPPGDDQVGSPSVSPAGTEGAPLPVRVESVTEAGGGIRLHCPNGTVIDLPAVPTAAEAVSRCGLSAPPPPTPTIAPPVTRPAPTTTTTAPRLPKILSASIHAADGYPDPGKNMFLCTIPPDSSWYRVPGDWCPPDISTHPRVFTWTATYDNGVTLTGTTDPITPGSRWTVRPNNWNGSITIDVDRTGAIGWGPGWD